MKKLLLFGIAALFLATGTAHANPNVKMDPYATSYAKMGAYLIWCDPQSMTDRARKHLTEYWTKNMSEANQEAYGVWIREIMDGKRPKDIATICKDATVKWDIKDFNDRYGYERPEPVQQTADDTQEQLDKLKILREIEEQKLLAAQRQALERESAANAALRRQQAERARLCYEEPTNCPADYTVRSYRYYRRW
jgi:hypothetical protein